MMFGHFRKFVFVLLIFSISFLFVSCKQESGSVTQAYTKLYNAVKSKDTEKIKQSVSRATKGLAETAAMQQNKPLSEVFANGFTATTFADSLPEIRDEKVQGNFGQIEVYSQKDKRWETLPFVLEDGEWKLAVGDLFAGTFQSPGKSQSQLEMENSNSQKLIPYGQNANGNFNGGKPPATTANVNTAQVKPDKPAANVEKKK